MVAPRPLIRRSFGATLADRAVLLRKTLQDAPALEVLDLSFNRYRGRSLDFYDPRQESGDCLHPRWGGAFPALLAEAFSSARRVDTWRIALEEAEALSDLAMEDILLTMWGAEVVGPFARRYGLRLGEFTGCWLHE